MIVVIINNLKEDLINEETNDKEENKEDLTEEMIIKDKTEGMMIEIILIIEDHKDKIDEMIVVMMIEIEDLDHKVIEEIIIVEKIVVIVNIIDQDMIKNQDIIMIEILKEIDQDIDKVIYLFYIQYLDKHEKV